MCRTVVPQGDSNDAGLGMFDDENYRVGFAFLIRVSGGKHLNSGPFRIRCKLIQFILKCKLIGHSLHDGMIGLSYRNLKGSITVMTS